MSRNFTNGVRVMYFFTPLTYPLLGKNNKMGNIQAGIHYNQVYMLRYATNMLSTSSLAPANTSTWTKPWVPARLSHIAAIPEKV
jgi:hypothetical protein